MKKIVTNIELFILLFLPHILLLLVLLNHYPHTGLGRIISIPFTLIINLVVAYVGCHLFHTVRNRPRLIIVTVVITLLITLFFYPQDNGSDVINLIFQDIFH